MVCLCMSEAPAGSWAKPHRAPVFISSAQHKCSQIPLTPPSKSNCSTIQRDKLCITAPTQSSRVVVVTAAVLEPEPYLKAAAACPASLPLWPWLQAKKQTASNTDWSSSTATNKQPCLRHPFRLSSFLLPSITLIRQTSGWCRHGPGGTCQ